MTRLKLAGLAALPLVAALALAPLSALRAQAVPGAGAEAPVPLTERQKAMQSMMAAMDPEARARMTVPDPYELLPDNRVIFRLKAPQAQNVIVRGSWPGGLGGETRVPMTKDAGGIWSVTTGPLPSDLQSFSFEVDGVTVQPSNGAFGEITRGLPAGDIAVPGGVGSDYADKGHPKGVLAYPYVPFMGSEKHLTVYTPPGYYEHPQLRYPVLYVTMGGRHDGTTGVGDSYIWNLLENDIAEGKAKPMIVVVLDPQAPGGNSDGWSAFAGGGNQTNDRYIKAAQAIADEIVPWVDRSFRTLPTRENRAIIGFSSPGAQGFLTGARNPEKFANVAAISGGFATWPGVAKQIESGLDPRQYRGPDLNRVADMEKLGPMIPKLTPAAKMKSITLYVGTNEPLIMTYRLLLKMLTDRGLKVDGIVNEGEVHDGRQIRRSMHDYLTRVFK
jgi:enterochelin esterase family protein